MKKYILFFLFLIAGFSMYAQQTLRLRPDSLHAYNSELVSYPGETGNNYSNYGVMACETWTEGGTTWQIRDVFRFDLSSIPSNAIVLSASLDLYCDNPTTTFNGSPLLR